MIKELHAPAHKYASNTYYNAPADRLKSIKRQSILFQPLNLSPSHELLRATMIRTCNIQYTDLIVLMSTS